MWELDPRFHTPGWAERRLNELREEQEKANMMHLCLPLPDGAIGAWMNGKYYPKAEEKSKYHGFFLKVGKQ